MSKPKKWRYLLLLCGVALAAQTPSSIPALVASLASPDLSARMDAFVRLNSMPHAAQRPDVQSALVKLLQFEDNAIESANKSGISPDDKWGEPYGEYVGQLADRVFRTAQAADSNDRATLLALLWSPANPGSVLSQWLATRSNLGVSDALAQATSPVEYDRMQAAGVLSDMLRLDRSGAHPLGGTDRVAAKRAIVALLKDTSPGVKVQAVYSIEHIEDPKDAPTLWAIAQADPSIRELAQKGGDWLSKRPALPTGHL